MSKFKYSLEQLADDGTTIWSSCGEFKDRSFGVTDLKTIEGVVSMMERRDPDSAACVLCGAADFELRCRSCGELVTKLEES